MCAMACIAILTGVRTGFLLFGMAIDACLQRFSVFRMVLVALQAIQMPIERSRVLGFVAHGAHRRLLSRLVRGVALGAIAVPMAARSSGALFCVALLARKRARPIECVRHVAISTLRRARVKCRFVCCFGMALIARERCGCRLFVRMRVVTTGAGLPLGIRMFRLYGRVTRRAGGCGGLLYVMR